MKIKTIAFVIYSLNSGGAERVVSTLANALINKYSVTIITFTDITPFYPLNNKIKIVHLFNNLTPSKNVLDSIIINFKLYTKIKKTAKLLSIDLLIGFMTNTNILTILAAKSINRPVLISERNNPECSHLPKFWSTMRKFIYPSTNFLIIQTQPIKEYFEKFVKKDKLQILPNPISSSHQKHKLNSSKQEKYNIVLSVGRLSNQKGHDIAIKAFTKINPDNWELHIVGEGPKRNEYEKLIGNLKMTSKIKLIGRDNNISNYYIKSKIFVFTSRFEGFPNALTEAMYFGLPCISTNCPTGPSELIENGENGFLIDIDDSESLSKKLEKLIRDEKLRRILGSKAEKSVAYLNEEQVVSKWDKLISKTLE